MQDETYLMIVFKDRPMTAREFIAFNKKILMELETYNPMFQNLFGWGFAEDALSYFKSDKSDFEEILSRQINFKESAYINDDPNDKEMHLDSYSYTGYSNSYSNTEKTKEGQLTVFIRGGEDERKSSALLRIDFSRYNYPEFQDREFVTQLLQKSLGFFDEVICAFVISVPFRREVDPYENNPYDIAIGWINYLPVPEIYDLLPDGVEKEHYENGTLFSISEVPASVEDAKIVKKAIQIRDTLGAKGYLNYR